MASHIIRARSHTDGQLSHVSLLLLLLLLAHTHARTHSDCCCCVRACVVHRVPGSQLRTYSRYSNAAGVFLAHRFYRGRQQELPSSITTLRTSEKISIRPQRMRTCTCCCCRPMCALTRTFKKKKKKPKLTEAGGCAVTKKLPKKMCRGGAAAVSSPLLLLSANTKYHRARKHARQQGG